MTDIEKSQDVVMADENAAAPAPAEDNTVPEQPQVSDDPAAESGDAEYKPAESADATDAPAAGDTEPAEAKPPSSQKPRSSSSKPIKPVGTAKKAGAAKKKGGASSSSAASYKAGDIVLAKLKGYPAWREYRYRRSRPWQDGSLVLIV
jgi:hypothetical protein